MIKIKRPILVSALGFIIGIIYGLYFEKSIAFAFIVFYLLINLLVCFCKLIKRKNILRYLKTIIKNATIVLFCAFALISNTYLIYLNNKYEKVYINTKNKIEEIAVVISKKEENEYTNTYTIKIKSGVYKNKKFLLNVKKEINLEYGDLINVEGEYIKPTTAKNYKGFDYSSYLKSKKIYGTIKLNKIEIIKNNALNPILIESNKIRNAIKSKINKLLPGETGGLLIGILLGDKEGITEETLQNFKASSLTHILAVSGLHTSYIVLRYNLYFNNK